MIHITVTPNSIEAIGHADYDAHGKDIICSAISILMYTLSIRGHMDKEESGHAIVVSEDKQALELIVEGLKLIERNYPQYVEVIEC